VCKESSWVTIISRYFAESLIVFVGIRQMRGRWKRLAVGLEVWKAFRNVEN
jgi:hypothetical protein